MKIRQLLRNVSLLFSHTFHYGIEAKEDTLFKRKAYDIFRFRWYLQNQFRATGNLLKAQYFEFIIHLTNDMHFLFENFRFKHTHNNANFLKALQ